MCMPCRTCWGCALPLLHACACPDRCECCSKSSPWISTMTMHSVSGRWIT